MLEAQLRDFRGGHSGCNSTSQLRVWGTVALAALGISIFLGERWERNVDLGSGSVLMYEDRASGGVRKGGAHQFQKIDEGNGHLSAEYGCVNFNDDPVRVKFSINLKALNDYKQDFGYAQSELDALLTWQKNALYKAYEDAVKRRLNQAELDSMSAAVKAEYKSRFRSFIISRGFSFKGENLVVADVPAIAKRSIGHLRPVAQQIARNAEKQDYDAGETIAAATSLVQTAVRYETVPLTINGKNTGGVYPPLETISKGRGDCDTKAALLASILLNWSKISLVGIAVPNHYLMGVLRNPAKGEAFVEYKGLRYVLIEPAGPAWLPLGSVAPTTRAFLETGQSYSIEPFSAK